MNCGMHVRLWSRDVLMACVIKLPSDTCVAMCTQNKRLFQSGTQALQIWVTVRTAADGSQVATRTISLNRARAVLTAAFSKFEGICGIARRCWHSGGVSKMLLLDSTNNRRGSHDRGCQRCSQRGTARVHVECASGRSIASRFAPGTLIIPRPLTVKFGLGVFMRGFVVRSSNIERPPHHSL